MAASHVTFRNIPLPKCRTIRHDPLRDASSIAMKRGPLTHDELRHLEHRGVDLISDTLPFGRLWYGEPDAIVNAIGYAKFRSRSHDAVIRVFDEAGNVIETHEHAGEFKEW